MTSRKRRSAVVPVTLTLTLLAACVVVGLAVLAYWGIPQRAEAVFGPPSSQLRALDRFTYAARLLQHENDLTTPAKANGSPVPFDIELGESVGTIASRLEARGVVRSAEAFRLYLVYSGIDTRLQAGAYELDPSSSSLQIANRLLDSTPTVITFHILAGWRAEEIAAALPTSGLSIAPDALLEAAQSSPLGIPRDNPSAEITGMEGFFLPDGYRFKRDISLNEMLSQILDNFDTKITPEIRQGFERQSLSLIQAVTMASIVEREAVVDDEQPMIASVFLNRLAIGMKLDSDPTVQYALGFDPATGLWWKNPLTLDDLQTDSPYNTYIYAGLPPGPISNPSVSALQAVAYPAQTPYYYFRARCDGSGRHTFAKTFEEHLQNACP